jgi:hypothetical protein
MERMSDEDLEGQPTEFRARSELDPGDWRAQGLIDIIRAELAARRRRDLEDEGS